MRKNIFILLFAFGCPVVFAVPFTLNSPIAELDGAVGQSDYYVRQKENDSGKTASQPDSNTLDNEKHSVRKQRPYKHGVFQFKFDSLIAELDKAVRQDDYYIQQRENYIRKVKSQLNDNALNNEGRYLIYKQLSDEYDAFQSDSSLLYAAKRLQIAEEINSPAWISDAKIGLARAESKAGMFSDAVEILGNIGVEELNKQQKITYYRVSLDIYIFWMEFIGDGNITQEMFDKRKEVENALIQLLPVDSYEYAAQYGTKYIESGEFEKAEIILKSFLPKLNKELRDYAILTAQFAHLYEQQGKIDLQKEFLAMSAITDVKAAIMENTSLRTLSFILYNEGDIERANTYIKKSMDDANFYNARLRNLQTSKILPVIDKAYQSERVRQQKLLTNLLTGISILSVVLLIAIFFIFRQMRKLSKAQTKIMEINARLNELNKSLKSANEQQWQTNLSLAEANHIKEQFISNFLQICTEYIAKLEKFKQNVHIKVKVGQINDVLKMTSSSADSAKELKELYENFDRAFLNIYPDFVEKLNRLLRLEEQYPVNTDNTLNQELRIFALIRLGITDSHQIATFLHYTLRTIYNYRSKVKSKAIDPDDNFEEKVKRLSL
jgi:hypothetical protein